MNSKMKHLKYIIFTIVLGITFPVLGQLKPVTVNLNIAPPTSVYLSDFTTSGSQRLTMIVNQSDENEPVLDVAFNFSIEGNGILLQSNPNFAYVPFSMDFGMNTLTGFDLDQYLNPANMIISGADPTEIIQTGSLPEGMYTFCVEVTDYLRRDKVISYQSCSMTTLLKNNPPQTVFPECASTVPFIGVQNVQFSWQANHDLSIQSEYTVKIVEVPLNVNPNDAMNGAGTPILEDHVVSNTNFLYDQTFVDLEIGKMYAYRIDVTDVMDLTTFENDGIGEVCWFVYGTEGGGTITLTGPENESQINSTGSVLLAWSNPSNADPADELYYKIKIVEVEGGQTAQEAMALNTSVFLEETDIVNPMAPYNFSLEQGVLDMEKNYAWQIESYVGDQVTAISEVWTLVSAPLLSSFVAAGKTITVISTNGGTDPSNLSGTGTMKLAEDGPDIPIMFEALDIGIYPSGNILEGGTMISPLENYVFDYGNADMAGLSFEASDIVLTSSELKLRGRMAWPFPHATISGEIPTVYSEVKDLYFQDYVLDGSMNLEEETYTLADPSGMKIKIGSTSNVQLTGEEAITTLNGTITLPSNYKDSDGGAVSYDYENQSDLYSMVLSDITNLEKIRLFDDTNIYLQPTKIIVDIDELASVTPDNASEIWKGFFFEKYDVIFDQELSELNEVVHNSEYTYSFDYNLNAEHKALIEETGLTMDVSYSYQDADSPSMKFKTFAGNFTDWTVKFQDGVVSNSVYNGEIYISPLGTEPFAFNVVIAENGFLSGSLNESLDGIEIESSGGGAQNELIITLNTVSFGGVDHLVAAANFNWINLECLDGGTGVEGFVVPNFKIWGSGVIGINTPNSQAPLNSVGSAKLEGLYSIDVDSIYAGLGNEGYVYEMVGSISLGSEVSGDGNAPVVAIQAQSVASNTSTDTLDASISGSIKGAFVNSIQIPSINIHVPGLFKVANKGVQFSSADTLWGSCFKGEVIIDIYKPKKVGLTAKIISGVTEAGTGYFFLEGSVGGTSLDGIPDSLKIHYQNFDGTAGNQNEGITIPLGIAEIHKLMFKLYINVLQTEGYKNGKPAFDFFPTDVPSFGAGFGLGIRDSGSNGDFLDISAGGFVAASSANFNVGFNLDAKIMKDLKMGGSIVYTTSPQRLIGSLYLGLKKPICIDVNGAVDLNFDTKVYKIKLGTKANKIMVIPYPNCIGVGVNGWLNLGTYFALDNDPDLDSLDVDFGLGVIVQAAAESSWYNFALFDLQAKITAGFNLGVQAKLSADLDPELQVELEEIGGWLDAWAELLIKVNSADGLEEYNLGNLSIAANFIANLDTSNPLTPYWNADLKITASIFDLDWKFAVKAEEMPFD